MISRALQASAKRGHDDSPCLAIRVARGLVCYMKAKKCSELLSVLCRPVYALLAHSLTPFSYDILTSCAIPGSSPTLRRETSCPHAQRLICERFQKSWSSGCKDLRWRAYGGEFCRSLPSVLDAICNCLERSARTTSSAVLVTKRARILH